MIARHAYRSREEWLADRVNFVGASEVASIIGLPCAYSTAFEVYLAKRGHVAPEQDNESLFWGNHLERAIAEGFAKRVGGDVVIPPTPMAEGPADATYKRATIDSRWLRDGYHDWEPLEIKNVSQWNRDDWLAGPPPHVAVQLQWQARCLDAPCVHVAALIGGNELIHYRVERDDAVIAALDQAVDAFWERVQNGDPPEATHRDLPALRRAYSERRGAEVELDWIDIRELLNAHNAVDRATVRKSAAAAKVQQAMGEATEGNCGGRALVTWRTNSAGNRVFRLTQQAKRLDVNHEG